MKILIVSDTHRRDENLKFVIEEEKPFDMLIHLGDVEGSEQWIPEWAGEGCMMAMVMGNNDFFSRLERELELEIGPHRALLTHGHYYGRGQKPGMRYRHVRPHPQAFSGQHRRGHGSQSRQSVLSPSGRPQTLLYDHDHGS